ncbi:MAG: hypothetical protein R3C03_19860 [Pirellulaceae bacterium]
MSQQNSDSLEFFDDAETGGFGDDLGMMEGGDEQQFLPPQNYLLDGKRGFDVYSLLLIMSFIMFTAAAIMLMIDASSY